MVAPRCPVFGPGDRNYPLYSTPLLYESCIFDVKLKFLLATKQKRPPRADRSLYWATNEGGGGCGNRVGRVRQCKWV